MDNLIPPSLLSKLPKSSTGSLVAKVLASPPSLIQLLQTQPSISAKVVDVIKISPEQISRLQSQSPQVLTAFLKPHDAEQEGKNKIIDASKTNIQAPIKNQLAIQLFAVKLAIQNKSFVAITNQEFTKNQTLNLNRENLDTLKLLPASHNIAVKAKVETVKNDSITALLRQTLPLQHKTTSNLLNLLSKLPPKTLPQISNVLIEKIINNSTIDSKAPTGEMIKRSIENSGVFLENKLVKTPHRINDDLRSLLNKLEKSLIQSQTPSTSKAGASSITMPEVSSQISAKLPKPQVMPQPTTVLNNAKNQPVAPTQKNTLQQVVLKNPPIASSELEKDPIDNKLIEALIKAVSIVKDIPTPTIKGTAVQKDAIFWLFNALGLKTSPQTSNKALMESAVLKLQQQLASQIQSSVSKIQLDQLKSLGAEKGTLEIGTQPVQVELPLKWNEQILPLSLQIHSQDEEIDPEEGKQNDHEVKKVKKWQVMMSFDLPNEEHLHVQLSLLEEQCSALLWAESKQLCQTTREHIDQLKIALEHEGLTVSKIHCFEGKPVMQNSSLEYSLVDIKT